MSFRNLALLSVFYHRLSTAVTWQSTRHVAFVPRISDNDSRKSPKSYRKVLSMSTYAKLDSPASERNKGPIWEILESRVISQFEPGESDSIRVLEVAAGAGVHTYYFASNLRKTGQAFRWYPTDPRPEALESELGYIGDEPGLMAFIENPFHLTLDSNGIIEEEAAQKVDGIEFDLFININMIHITKWDVAVGLMKLAGDRLKTGGQLYMYGPYKVGGTMVESNEAFDLHLKAIDPGYGIRNVEDVVAVARENGLELVEQIEMPSNNLSLIFRKL